MKKIYRNIRVLAVNNGNRRGFNVYVEFSGQREYLMTHRHNGPMFMLLKDGISYADIKRCNPDKVLALSPAWKGRKDSVKVGNMIRHLQRTIDEYLVDREIA